MAEPAWVGTTALKKDIIKSFNQLGLRITIQANLRIVNFLVITFNLSNEKYYISLLQAEWQPIKY